MAIEFPTYDLSGDTAGQLGDGSETLEKSSDASSRLPPTTAKPEYPYNHATVTRAGHEMHWDDTPGRERIRMAHRTGTYFEIAEDGRKVELVQANEYKYVKGGLTLTIDKNGDIKIGGMCRVVIGGDTHVEINGNVTAAVSGSLNASVYQNAEVHAGQNATLTAGENITATAGQNIYASAGADLVAAVNGNMTTVVNGNSDEIVNGNKTTTVAGSYDIKVGGNKNVTVSGDYHLTASSISIIANAELFMSGDHTTTHAVSVNRWDTLGCGFVYFPNYIHTYTDGVTGTHSPPAPPIVPYA